MIYGVPKLRFVEADRKSPGGVTEADKVMQPLLDGSDQAPDHRRKEKGHLGAREPRILFEGTLEEAEEILPADRKDSNILNALSSMYTDGMPIVIPTEERVKEMLKGTSHKADELITLQRDMKWAAVVRTQRLKAGG